MVQELKSQVEQLLEETRQLKQRVADLEARQVPPSDQKVADWAKAGYTFVTTPRNGETISDGERPEDHVTRQEVWTMLERLRRLWK